MENNSITHGLWEKTAPPAPDFTPLKGDITTDVAIIGAGYTGLSAALHLAGDGVKTTVLEAQTVGFGGAGRNVGLVNAGLWLMPSEVIEKLGREKGEAMINLLGASPELVFNLVNEHQIECEAMNTGTLHCAHSPAGYKALIQRETQWLERGAPVKLFDQKQAAPHIGSTAFYGALLDKRAGTVQPLAYANGLSRAAQTAGAKIFTNTPVLSHKRSGSAWEIKTPGGTVTAKAVILAVQGYPEHGFKTLAANLIPFNFFQFATPPLPKSVLETILPGRQGAWDTALVLSSWRLDQAGRLIVGSVGQADNFGFGLHKNWVQRSITKVFPQIGKVDLSHAWHGRIAMTPDHIPRFHILGPDFICITSYNGRGIGPGSVFGKLMARYLIKDGDVEVPLPVTAPKKVFLRDIFGLYYEAGARLYHMAQRRTPVF